MLVKNVDEKEEAKKDLPSCNTELPAHIVISNAIQHHNYCGLWLWHWLRFHLSVRRLVARSTSDDGERVNIKLGVLFGKTLRS